MATPNYSYEKRQRELAKKRKKEEKAQRKTHTGSGSDVSGTPESPAGSAESVGSANSGDAPPAG